MWCSSARRAKEDVVYEVEERKESSSPALYEGMDGEPKLLQTPGQPLLYAFPVAESSRQFLSNASSQENGTESRADFEQQSYTTLNGKEHLPGTEAYARPSWPTAESFEIHNLTNPELHRVPPIEQPTQDTGNLEDLRQTSPADLAQAVPQPAFHFPAAAPTDVQLPVNTSFAKQTTTFAPAEAAYQQEQYYTLVDPPSLLKQSSSSQSDACQQHPADSSRQSQPQTFLAATPGTTSEPAFI